MQSTNTHSHTHYDELHEKTIVHEDFHFYDTKNE